MEFSIDIHSKITGEITIEDFSREYGQYIDEDVEVVTSFDHFKYSECTTINALVKVNTTGSKVLKTIINEHGDYLDTCTFNTNEDGYYVIQHIVLPNLKWYENSSQEYKEYYETIYVIDDEVIYKQNSAGLLEECSIKEILERNIENTTIKKCIVDTFFTGNLQQCYIGHCKNLFNSMLGSCTKVDTFDRDFVWMTLNIIDYLIGFKQYMEAQRLIEIFTKCGGHCSSTKSKTCGCS